MLRNKIAMLVAAACTVVLVGCNSGGGEAVTPVIFTSQVTFGDSLSDVGTYAVGKIAAVGGGLYTVNSITNGSLTPANWTEVMATMLGLPQPCPAVTGLNGSVFGTAITNHPGCTSYAMGGAMVTEPDGPGNKFLPSIFGGSPELGQLTYPVVQQIQNHLAINGGRFTGSEIVTVLAGGNDAIVNFAMFAFNVEVAYQTALPNGIPAAEAAAAAAAATWGPIAVHAMGQAGGELAAYVKNLILANGANYVAVLTAPDLSSTPFAIQAEAQLPGSQSLINLMMETFNSQLTAGLNGSKALIVDLHTASVEQTSNPAAFGLSNVTDPACKLPEPIDPSVNLLDSSLVCNVATNVIPGDIRFYAFADTVHPTPYGYLLIATFVQQAFQGNGWL